MTTAVITASAAGCWWRIFRREHLAMLAKFALAGLLTAGVGAAIYWTEVSHYGLNKYEVRPLNWPFVTLLGFGINWAIFRRRRPKKLSSGKRWFAVAIVISLFNFGAFVLLSTSLRMQYMVAQMAIMIPVGLAHYVVTHKKIFPQLQKDTA